MSDPLDEEVLGKAYDARLMRRFFAYVRPHRPLVLVSLLLVLLRIGAELAGPFLLKGIVDGPIRTGDAAGLKTWVLLFIATIAVMSLLEVLGVIATNLAGQRIIYDIRTGLFRHLQRLPQAFYDRTPVGRLVTRSTNDVENLNELFTSGLVAFLADSLLLVGILVAMFVLSWELALVTVALTPVIVGAALVFRHYARERYRQMRERIAKLNAWLNESVNGMRTIQAFTREKACAEKWDGLNGRFRESAVGAVFVYSVFFPAVELIASVAVGLLLWYGGLRILEGRLSFGDFLGFWYCAQKFFHPVRELSEKYNILQAAMASSERIFRLLDEPAAPEGGGRKAEELKGDVAFEDLRFSYDGRTPVLEGISFRVQAGQTLAIVGHTGAGKSTIINLLLRLYDPQAGRVTVDGIDLREYDARSLRRRVALVLQDVFLFSGSVADNIRLGGDLPASRVEEAARAVNADRFVARLPKGYDTPVGERGLSLSTGERQLLSFARALAVDPRILILDEATSSVDAENEALIQEATGRLLKGRTSIVIAHRLSTVRRADRILVLHHGRIAEEGTHDELIRKDGIYARLHRLQFSLS